MKKQEYITVSEMAKKHGVSDKRILQMLKKNPGKRARCLTRGNGVGRITLFELPSNLFDDYSPNLIRQAAGNVEKKQR